MNTIAIKEYIVAEYNAQSLQESISTLEYYKVDIIMSFPEILPRKHNDTFDRNDKVNLLINMQELVNEAKHYPLSQLNIEVWMMRINSKEVKIVFEHRLGYYTIKGLDEFDPNLDDLSRELCQVGEQIMIG